MWSRMKSCTQTEEELRFELVTLFLLPTWSPKYIVSVCLSSIRKIIKKKNYNKKSRRIYSENGHFGSNILCKIIWRPSLPEQGQNKVAVRNLNLKVCSKMKSLCSEQLWLRCLASISVTPNTKPWHDPKAIYESVITFLIYQKQGQCNRECQEK